MYSANTKIKRNQQDILFTVDHLTLHPISILSSDNINHMLQSSIRDELDKKDINRINPYRPFWERFGG